MSDAASDIVLARRVSGEVLLPDADAAEIGELYRKAGASLIESVEYSRACGQRLAAKKASLPHGAWLPWLRDNADVLGFNSRQTASRLMALANGTLNAPFDEAEAVAISRNIWGNDTRRVDAYTGEMEWYTPSVYIEAAARCWARSILTRQAANRRRRQLGRGISSPLKTTGWRRTGKASSGSIRPMPAN
jgi:hypothetical protein